MRTTPKGLVVFDQESDNFNHDTLAANWDLIDSLLQTAANAVETLAAIPTTGNFAGRLVMLSSSVSGASGTFPAWTLIRYDGSAWKNAGAIETLAAVPSTGNYTGRIVMLSAANSGFAALDLIRYDGSAWDYVSNWKIINNGAGATNIKGQQMALDAFISDSARGFVLKDRTTGTNYRLYFNNGTLSSEVVT